ncbi:type VII secretion protein EccB [Actinomycetospora termitidis]|uniref:Type VII secretion protein EccB n=1 Tax=Actinomycetospora termitidis TaxID=3053470 RepID=A0ABT7MBN6_9PSEU|nr:type VII secretion protein EccB [Actinomycetospora sp. Odt1-22]MDL5157871.1 type VII secretion protein EccB [Actinomycetospora sp. Odt1-22]
MTPPPEPTGRRAATAGQVVAARFSARRLASALVRRDPAPTVDPLRSQSRATIAGVLLAALGLGAAAVVGAVHRPADWRTSAIVVGERTGALAVVTRGDPPALIGVPNLASARLAAAAVAGGPAPGDPVEIADDVLAGAPRARPVGIVDAPAPPPPDLPGPAVWSVCDTTAPDPALGAARPRTTTTVIGAARPPGRPPASREALVVVDRAGQNWLVAGGTRARLDVTRPAVVEALGLGGLLPRPASSGFLAALPEAPPITPPTIARRGAPVPVELAGERAGGVVRVAGAGNADTYLLVLTDGVQVVPELLARLIRLDDPALAGVPIPTVAPAQVANAPVSRAVDVSAFPDPAPVPLPPDRAPSACADRTAAPGAPVTVSVAVDALPPGVALRQADGSGDRVDRAVLPGTGATVREEDGALVVVSATGTVHGVPDAATAEALGLGRTFSPAPRAVIGLLPTGAPLSVEAATRPLG